MPAGRKTKYNDNFPLLAESYARDGLSDKEIAVKLDISHTMFYEYQAQYPEFSDALKRGKKPVDIEVENALLKIARGFEFEEKSVEVVDMGTRTIYTDDGQETVPVQKKTVKKTVKTVTPNLGAIKFWLTNRVPEKWRNLQEVDVFGAIELELKEMDDSQIDKEIEALKNGEVGKDTSLPAGTGEANPESSE